MPATTGRTAVAQFDVTQHQQGGQTRFTATWGGLVRADSGWHSSPITAWRAFTTVMATPIDRAHDRTQARST